MTLDPSTREELGFDPIYQCPARSKRTGERCRRPMIQGGTVCWHHGGASPQARAKARARLEQANLDGEVGALVQLAVEELGQPEDIDPLEAVMAALHRARVMAKVYGWLHAGLSARPDKADDGTRADALYGPDHLGDARPHAIELALRHWTTEEARIGKLAIDAGVEQKRLERMERAVDEFVEFGQTFARSLGMLLELALTAAGVDAAVVRQVVAEAEPEAFRRALQPGTVEVVEASSTARDGAR